jgi:hypothetical protein
MSKSKKVFFFWLNLCFQFYEILFRNFDFLFNVGVNMREYKARKNTQLSKYNLERMKFKKKIMTQLWVCFYD